MGTALRVTAYRWGIELGWSRSHQLGSQTCLLMMTIGYRLGGHVSHMPKIEYDDHPRIVSDEVAV